VTSVTATAGSRRPAQAAELRKPLAGGPCCPSRDGGRRVADAAATTADPDSDSSS
jgi:hypothetical protein